MRCVFSRKSGSKAILFIVVFILGIFSYYNLWNKNRIIVDAPSYYAYLPAIVIHQDLHLLYVDKDRDFYKDKVWFMRLPDKQILIKHPIGLSIALLPFFTLGHLYVLATGGTADGYSMPYQNACSLGVIFYLFLGLVFLRKFLLMHFKESTVTLCLLSIVLGTNLLWYSSFEGLMSHSITFSFLAIALYLYHEWLMTEKKWMLLIFSVAIGFLILIRPVSLLFLLYFFIYTLIEKQGLSSFIAWFKKHIKALLVSAVIIAAIASIQACYLRYATGHWLYDFYGEEHFVFNKPELFSLLFSFRKGVFVYCPILLFALAGFIMMYRRYKAFFYAGIIPIIAIAFILSSWWAWSSGISFGMRTMIDVYPLFCFPLCYAFQQLSTYNIFTKAFLYIIVPILIFFSLFQTWQYKNGLIHYDDMSKEAYFKGLFQTDKSDEWTDLLKPYDWERRIKGLDQIEYSKSFFNTLNQQQRVYLRASNIAFITVNSKAQNAMAALAKDYGANESFFIQHLKGDTITIQSNGKLFWSYKPYYEDATTASEAIAGPNEKFTYEYLHDAENQIIIKAINGKYISFADQWPFIIKADKDAVSKNEVFRYFLYDNKQP
jgi:hypothetical protein